MAVGASKFHRRALTAFNQLSSEEQAQVQESLAALVGTPVAQWSATPVKRLPGDQSLYLLPVNDSLRAIVRADADQEPEVLDLVRHETLDFFARTAATNGV
ncbi:MAG: hypothetical protein JNM56_06110 [Planctomycetia bacterium]|nr:hypothetical protein [Planctomycetia bacterium]